MDVYLVVAEMLLMIDHIIAIAWYLNGVLDNLWDLMIEIRISIWKWLY